MSQFDPTKRDDTRLGRGIRRLFPERLFMVRSGDDVQCIKFSSKHQIMMVLAAFLVFGWSAFATYQTFALQTVIAVKDHHISSAYAAYDTLAEQVGAYRERVGAVVARFETNHSDIVELLQTETPKVDEPKKSAKAKKDAKRKDAQKQLREAKERLAALQEEWSKADRQRTAMSQQIFAELGNFERDLQTLSDRQQWMTADIEAVDVEMRKVVLQRDLAMAERDELSRRNDVLQDRLSDMQDSQVAVVHRFSDLTNTSIGEIEEMLSLTGLDLNELLNKQSDRTSQGGPFIPVLYSEIGDTKLSATLLDLNTRIDRWGGLQALQRTLPLGVPLEHYQITSYFGKRRDPFNKKMAMHEGLDFGAPRRSPIFATAPGKVKFSGYKPGYGKVVIVDHGLGFTTVYAHLHSTLVKKGDIVDTTTKIARVGSSGRSTGPHLHYEVRVNDKPYNPLKFLKAGRHVFKG